MSILYRPLLCPQVVGRYADGAGAGGVAAEESLNHEEGRGGAAAERSSNHVVAIMRRLVTK
jgi:hypothetical protein